MATGHGRKETCYHCSFSSFSFGIVLWEIATGRAHLKVTSVKADSDGRSELNISAVLAAFFFSVGTACVGQWGHWKLLGLQFSGSLGLMPASSSQGCGCQSIFKPPVIPFPLQVVIPRRSTSWWLSLGTGSQWAKIALHSCGRSLMIAVPRTPPGGPLVKGRALLSKEHGLHVLLNICERFSLCITIRGGFALRGTLTMSKDIFGCYSSGEVGWMWTCPLVSGGQKLFNILGCTGQPPTTKIIRPRLSVAQV